VRGGIKSREYNYVLQYRRVTSALSVNNFHSVDAKKKEDNDTTSKIQDA
jgi:hypothetical protein